MRSCQYILAACPTNKTDKGNDMATRIEDLTPEKKEEWFRVHEGFMDAETRKRNIIRLWG